MENKNPFTVPASRIAEEMRMLAAEVGIEGLAFFQGSFKKQGFTDRTLEKWVERKPIVTKKKGVYISKPNDPGRAILIHRGTLRRSLRQSVAGLDITFSSNLPYSRIHNEGGVIKTRGGKTYFFMRKRQYIGESQTLFQKVDVLFDKRMNKIFNK